MSWVYQRSPRSNTLGGLRIRALKSPSMFALGQKQIFALHQPMSALGQKRTSVPHYSRDGGYDDPSTRLAKERDEGSVAAELSCASVMLRSGPHEGTGNDQTHAR